jgi:hypothetical protein
VIYQHWLVLSDIIAWSPWLRLPVKVHFQWQDMYNERIDLHCLQQHCDIRCYYATYNRTISINPEQTKRTLSHTIKRQSWYGNIWIFSLLYWNEFSSFKWLRNRGTLLLVRIISVSNNPLFSNISCWKIVHFDRYLKIRKFLYYDLCAFMHIVFLTFSTIKRMCSW